MTPDIPDGFPITLPKHALAGLDGAEDDRDDVEEGGAAEGAERAPDRPLTLSPRASERLKAEIAALQAELGAPEAPGVNEDSPAEAPDGGPVRAP